VAALFASVGLLADLLSQDVSPPVRAAAVAAISGGSAALLLWVVLTRILWLPVVVLLVVAALQLLQSLLPTAADASGRHTFHVAGAIAGIALSYSWFTMFALRSGLKFVRLEAELSMAQRIHQLLVPAFDCRIGTARIIGRSIPSGEVGGDLVDLVETGADGAWTAYIADVSGHGVSAGVLMGMTKSAVRMGLAAPGDLGDVVARLNDVLVHVSQPEMFVTLAAVRPAAEGTLQVLVAGHLPVLHYRAASQVVNEVTSGHMLLGFAVGQTFETVDVEAGPGDLLVLLTDGLTEVFDERDQEFGLEGLSSLLAKHGDEALPQIVDRMLEAVRSYGPLTDDQSLILIRLGATAGEEAADQRVAGTRSRASAGSWSRSAR
jgi:serine phosphatase RsbU (regulator of sigma subunit)